MYSNDLLLMIPEILSGNYSDLFPKMLIILCAWITVLLAMLIDLHYGLKKAKMIGEARTSEGFRRSVTKFKDYFSSLIFAFLFDVLLSVILYYLPFPMNVTPPVTILAALGLTYTEYKSVREKADQKLRRKIDTSFLEMASFYTKMKEDGMFEKLQEFINKKNENNDQDTGT